MIYQVHEIHGRHIAYSRIEAEQNEGNGWKTVSEDEFYVRKVESPQVPAVEQKRRGRPPKVK